MLRDATAAIQTLKILSDTNHNTLPQTHLWDITVALQKTETRDLTQATKGKKGGEKRSCLSLRLKRAISVNNPGGFFRSCFRFSVSVL